MERPYPEEKYHRPVVKSGAKPPSQSMKTPKRSLSSMVDEVPEANGFYEEFKHAVRGARDPMTGQALLLDVLVTLRVFPNNWNENTQILQFLSKSKKNIPVDLRSNVAKNLFLILCALQDIPFNNESENVFDGRLFGSYVDEISLKKEV